MYYVCSLIKFKGGIIYCEINVENWYDKIYIFGLGR